MKKTSLIIAGFTLMTIGTVLVGCDTDPIESPEPVACFSVSNNTPNRNEFVNFTNCSENAGQFEWNFGDGNTSELTSPSHAYSSGGTFTVTLTAKNDEGFNSKSDVITITEECCSFSGSQFCESDYDETSTGYTWDEYREILIDAGATCD